MVLTNHKKQVINNKFFWCFRLYPSDYFVKILLEIVLIVLFFNKILLSQPGNFNLISPVKGVIVSTNIPVFSWQQSTGAQKYYLWISSKSSNFNINYPDFFAYEVHTTSFVLSYELNENVTYWWKINAVDLNNEYVSAGPEYFIVNCKNDYPLEFFLISPSSNSVLKTQNITFLWSETTDPDPFDKVKYELVYSKYSDFKSSITIHNINITSYSVSDLSDNSVYYWFVIAIDKYQATTKSEINRFYVNILNQPPEKVELFYPPYDKIINTSKPVFFWSKSQDPDPEDKLLYTLEYSKNKDFTQEILFSTSETSFELQQNLEDRTTYYWKITVKDIYDYSVVSDTFVFYVNINTHTPQNFDLLYPANNSIVNSSYISFVWNPSSDLDIGDRIFYTLIISSYSNFISSFVFSDFGNNSYTDIGLKENTTYYWKVMVRDNEIIPHIIESNQIFNFFIPVLSVPLYPVGLKSERTQNTLTLTWKPVLTNTDNTPITDLVGYKIYKFNSLYNTVISSYIFVSSNTLSFTEILSSTEVFFYKITAVDISGIESKDSIIVNSENKNINIMSQDKNVVLTIPEKINSIFDEIYIDILKYSQQEDQKIIYYYDIKIYNSQSNEIINYKFPENINIKFLNLIKDNYCILWYNGIQFIKLITLKNTENIDINTVYPGKYKISKIDYIPQNFTVKFLNPEKIFTPNGDGINDEITIFYENPNYYKITGKIYDITGTYINDMKTGQTNTLVWDGKDNHDNYVQRGIYIYQINVEEENKIFNGTIVVSR